MVSPRRVAQSNVLCLASAQGQPPGAGAPPKADAPTDTKPRRAPATSSSKHASRASGAVRTCVETHLRIRGPSRRWKLYFAFGARAVGIAARLQNVVRRRVAALFVARRRRDDEPRRRAVGEARGRRRGDERRDATSQKVELVGHAPQEPRVVDGARREYGFGERDVERRVDESAAARRAPAGATDLGTSPRCASWRFRERVAATPRLRRGYSEGAAGVGVLTSTRPNFGRRRSSLDCWRRALEGRSQGRAVGARVSRAREPRGRVVADRARGHARAGRVKSVRRLGPRVHP